MRSSSCPKSFFITVIASRTASRAPGGMSCTTPPGRMYALFMRRPVISSKTRSTCSRALNPTIMIVVAPSSLPPVARHTRCEAMRLSSIIITRMTVARSGMSSVMPSSFSTARQ